MIGRLLVKAQIRRRGRHSRLPFMLDPEEKDDMIGRLLVKARKDE